MRNFSIIILLVSTVLSACSSNQSVRTNTLLHQWQFTQDTTDNPTWKNVIIPHDWAICGPFDRANDLQEVVRVNRLGKQAGVGDSHGWARDITTHV